MKTKTGRQFRKIKLSWLLSNLLGKAFDVVIAFLYLSPIGPLIDFFVVVCIDSDTRFHGFHPRAITYIVSRLLSGHVELAFGESDIGVWVALADVITPFELLVDRRRSKPTDAHIVPADWIVVTKQVVLTADGDRCPIAVSLLFG